MKSRLVCVLCSVAVLGGCPLLFSFDRDADVITGTIRGQGLRTDVGAEEPASFVRVHTVGAGRDQFTASDGTFRVEGLSVGNWVLRLRDDRDGNGWPERTMTVATRLVAWTPPLTIDYEDQDVVRTPLLEGRSITVPGAAAGEDAPREPVGIDLGAVRLEATFPVKGAVLLGDAQLPPDASGLLGRVYVVRSACFTDPAVGEVAAPAIISQSTCPTDLAGVSEALQLGADAWAPVDANGDFALPAVASGTFALVPMIFAVPGLGDAVQEPLFIGTPLVLDGAPPDEGVQFEVGVLSLPDVAPDAPVVSDTRNVEIIIAPDPRYLLTDEAVGTGGYAMQTLDDRRPPPCLPFIPDQALPGFGDTRIVPLSEPVRTGDRIAVDAQLHQGVWDLRICVPALGEGELVDVVVLPPDGTSMVIGPVLLVDPEEDDPTDRDHDGILGLPLLDGLSGQAWDDVRDLWVACAATCASPAAYRVDDGPATCEVDLDGDGDVETVDCDDDGDGQPDVTEAPRCVETGRGPDYDSDALCGGEDPFPYCALNTAAACVASVDVLVSTALSPTLLDPTCEATIDVQLGDRYCEAVGTGAGDCGRFSMVCQPTYLVRAACLVDNDCADDEHCRFGRCYASTCDAEDPTSCGAGAVCAAPEEVCLPGCIDDGDCTNDTECASAFPGAPTACYPIERGGEGAPCAVGSQCQAGFSCVETCAGLTVDGVELPPECGEGGELEGLSFCQRDCSVDDPSACRADQVCVPGAFGLSGQCWFPAVDITCECRDSVTGLYRPVRTDAVLEASSCTVEGVDDLWRECTAFIDDPEGLGVPLEPDPDPDPEPIDGGVFDGGAFDGGVFDGGDGVDASQLPDDAGTPQPDGGSTPDAGTGEVDAGLPPTDAGVCLTDEICWNGIDDDCAGGVDDGCAAPEVVYPPSPTFFEGRSASITPVVTPAGADVLFEERADAPLPSWLSLDPLTGTLSGSPAGTDVGVVSASVDVTVGTYPALVLGSSSLAVLPPLHDHFTFDSADHFLNLDSNVEQTNQISTGDPLVYGSNMLPGFGTGIVDQCAGLFDNVGYVGSTTTLPSFTVSLWFRTSQITAERALVEWSTDMTSGGWKITLEDGGVTYSFHPATVGIAPQSVSGAISPNTWTHVVVSHDATNGATLYLGELGGALVSQGTTLGSAVLPAIIDQNDLFVAFSGNQFAGSSPYFGEMDELYIFEDALPAAVANVTHQRGVDGLDLGWQ